MRGLTPGQATLLASLPRTLLAHGSLPLTIDAETREAIVIIDSEALLLTSSDSLPHTLLAHSH